MALNHNPGGRVSFVLVPTDGKAYLYLFFTVSWAGHVSPPKSPTVCVCVCPTHLINDRPITSGLGEVSTSNTQSKDNVTFVLSSLVFCVSSPFGLGSFFLLFDFVASTVSSGFMMVVGSDSDRHGVGQGSGQHHTDAHLVVRPGLGWLMNVLPMTTRYLL